MAGPDSSTTGPDGPPEGGGGKRSLGRRILGWTGSTMLNILLVGAVVALVVVVGLRTSLGNETIVRAGVAFADGRVAGSISVGDVRSANLLRRARLLDVELLTPEGDTLLVADSVEVAYDLFGLVRGDIAFSRLQIWGAGLHWEAAGTPEAPGPTTLERFLGPDTTSADPTAAGGGRAIVLRDVRVDDSRVRVRIPTTADSTGLFRIQPGPDGPRLALDATVEVAELPRVEMLPTGRGGTTIEVDRLEGILDLLAEPLAINAAAAELRLSDRWLIADVRNLATGLGQVEGTVVYGLGETDDLRLQADLSGLDLTELRWLFPDLPALTGATGLTGRIDGETQRWTLVDGDFTGGGGELDIDGGVRFTPSAMAIEALALTMSEFPTSLLDPLLPPEVEVPAGTVTGSLRLDGPADAFSVEGRVTLRTGGRATTAELDGVVLAGESPGVRGMRVTLDPLDWGLLGTFAPTMRLTGPGRARIEATGSLADGLRLTADLTHSPPDRPNSHIALSGNVLNDDGWVVDVQGDLSPLSLGAIRHDWPDLPLEGAISGSFRARGPIDDLRVRTDLTGDYGALALDVRLDATAPTEGIELSGEVEDFRAARFLTGIEEPTSLTGQIEFSGRGFDLSSLAGEGRVRLRDSRINGLTIDSTLIAARIVSSELRIDTLQGTVGGFEIQGEGELAVDSLSPAGELRLTFDSPDLSAIRPMVMGDQVVARDTLSDLQRELLVLGGTDPDTLPLLEDVTIGGRVSGELVVRGSVSEFAVEGDLVGREITWGPNYVESGELTFTASGLPSLDAPVDFELRTDSARVAGRTFVESTIEGEVSWPSADLRAEITGEPGESWHIETGLLFENGGVRADAREFSVVLDSVTYRMQEPATLIYTDSTRRVNDLVIALEGPDPVRIRADGVLPYRGVADFTLDVERLDISRLGGILQREDLEADGLLDLSMRVTGTAESPRIVGEFSGDSIRWGEARFRALEGFLDYADRVAEIEVVLRDQDTDRVFLATGTVPIDLSLRSGVDRITDEPMDLTVRTDELAARSLLAFLPELEDVEGVVTGEFRIRGTLDDPVASGDLRLENGAWTLGSIGVRHTDVDGTLELVDGNTLRVDATAEAGGTARVTGTIDLTPLTDPGFDLVISLEEFRAVDRLDVAGSVSGDLTLTGRYLRPVIEGDLGVDEGTLYLDEFQRSIGVLDLTDPRFAAIIDTTDIGGRQILEQTENPFMEGLSMDISLNVESNTWLRGSDLQVELSGRNVLVFYDRQQRDLSLLGDFQVERGQATYLGKVFDVQGGEVRFLGTPGINPQMDVQAVTTIRRQEGEALEIDFHLGGTLMNPTVRVSTDEQGLSESDLFSYLVVGRPTSGLTTGVLSSGLGAAGSWLSGTLANQLATLAQQELSLIDYLSISQVGDLGLGAAGGVGASFAGTQVEIGRYFANGDIFGALILRPLSQLGASTNVIAGARVEWESPSAFQLEAFVEDRFLRSTGVGLVDFASRARYVIGFSVFREWGY